jgi:hypothetical protein
MVSAVENNCVDSDGLDYFNKGVVNGLEKELGTNNLSQGLWQDYCGVAAEEEGMLVEYTCNFQDDVEKRIYSCPNGCVKGVCINPIVSETVTCVFEDSDEEESCQNYFYYGYLKPLFEQGDKEYIVNYHCETKDVCAIYMEDYNIQREDILKIVFSDNCTDSDCSFDVTYDLTKQSINNVPRLYCNGVNNCSIKVTGEQGTKIKWRSLCRERNMEIATLVSGGYSIEEALSDRKMTTINGVDKIVEFECKGSILKDFIAPTYRKTISAVSGFFMNKEKGNRISYYLCQDGTEGTNVEGECKSFSFNSLNSDLEKLCEGHCDRFGEKCGDVLSHSKGCKV